MLKVIIGSIAGLTLAALAGAPAQAAQVRITLPIPHLEIRIAHEAPPPMRVERETRRPDRRAVWTRGYWDWQGTQWVWISGRWERPVRRGRWIQARYTREGSGWRYEPAHWSYQRVVESDDYRNWKRDQHRDHHSDHDGRDRRN